MDKKKELGELYPSNYFGLTPKVGVHKRITLTGYEVSMLDDLKLGNVEPCFTLIRNNIKGE